jgi:hypothetical protein
MSPQQMQISSSPILLKFWDMMGWVKTSWAGYFFFCPSHHRLATAQQNLRGFIQIEVFAELWVSWAGLNLLLILPMLGTPAEAIGTISPTEPSPGTKIVPARCCSQKIGD